MPFFTTHKRQSKIIGSSTSVNILQDNFTFLIYLDKTDAENGTRINNVGRLDGVLRQIDKNKPLVEFALGTISNKLFVSKY